VPNPFTGTTSIRFTLAQAGPVDLDLYNAGGRLVRHLSGFSPAGPGALNWDARGTDGQRTPPGVYYCRFLANGQRQAGPVILIQ
jgi:flagellar hook assembly protein FlgD